MAMRTRRYGFGIAGGSPAGRRSTARLDRRDRTQEVGRQTNTPAARQWRFRLHVVPMSILKCFQRQHLNRAGFTGEGGGGSAGAPDGTAWVSFARRDLDPSMSRKKLPHIAHNRCATKIEPRERADKPSVVNTRIDDGAHLTVLFLNLLLQPFEI